MACKRCEISTFVKDNGVKLFFVTETWLSATSSSSRKVQLQKSEDKRTALVAGM